VRRLAEKIARGATRLALALGAGTACSLCVLYAVDALFINGNVGGEAGFWALINHIEWVVGGAVAAGILAAIATDRAWRHLRTRGPSLSRRL
jgi:hypothetical protein